MLAAIAILQLRLSVYQLRLYVSHQDCHAASRFEFASHTAIQSHFALFGIVTMTILYVSDSEDNKLHEAQVDVCGNLVFFAANH
jgi:hypothetical protein